MELTVSDICKATGGRLRAGEPGIVIRSITIDSRMVGPDALFVPLKGTQTDGHAFIPAAFDAGAVAALVKQDMRELVTVRADAAVIEVDNTLRALGDIAGWWRDRCSATIVAITGSNGKTSTKEMAWSILSRRFVCFRTPGNFNNLIGLPLTLCSVLPSHAVAILEMGMSEPGEIRRLCAIGKPQIGLITNIGPSHLEHLKTIEAVAHAKGELFESLPKGGTAIVNVDDPRTVALISLTRAQVLTFGINGGEVTVGGLCGFNGSGARFTLQVAGRRAEVRLALPGKHFVSNALAAAAIARALDIDIHDIVAGLGSFRGVPGRMELLSVGTVRIINDSYNANPASMHQALQVLASLPGARRRIAVLGDMLELGEHSAEYHRELGTTVAGLGIDYLFVTGEFALETRMGAQAGGMPAERIVCRDDAADLGRALLNIMDSGDAILVKGSRGVRMERVIEVLHNKRRDNTASPQAG